MHEIWLLFFFCFWIEKKYYQIMCISTTGWYKWLSTYNKMLYKEGIYVLAIEIIFCKN